VVGAGTGEVRKEDVGGTFKVAGGAGRGLPAVDVVEVGTGVAALTLGVAGVSSSSTSGLSKSHWTPCLAQLPHRG
jgi:hypothetical protein